MKALSWHMIRHLILIAVAIPVVTGCARQSAAEDPVVRRVVPAAHLVNGAQGAYQPDRSVIGQAASKGNVSVTTSSQVLSRVPMARFTDPWGGAVAANGYMVSGGREVTVDLGVFDASSDFGANGSMTLYAETLNYPLSGGAYPVMTGFFVDHGTVVDYVKVSSGCRSSGMWTCNSGGVCTPNSACSVQTGSAFGGRDDWDQHQVPPYGFQTTNLFPRCDASLGSWKAGSADCPFSGGLVSGHYYANYLLLSNSGNPVNGQYADLKVTTMVRRDSAARAPADRAPASVSGGLSLNLVLVGDRNIADSRTVAGSRNLNLLFKEVNTLFSTASGAGIRLNDIKVYEWSDADGGDRYAQVSMDGLGDLFESGSKGVDAEDEGDHVNLFLVSDIQSGSNSFTVLGLAGGILGPPVNGTQGSGLAFSSFDSLASYNPGCTWDGCSRDSLEGEFLETATTITHELGHYLGLNHPTERPTRSPDLDSSYTHDSLSDTPKALARTSGTSILFDAKSVYFYPLGAPLVQDAPLSGSCYSACNAASGATPYYASLTSPKTVAFCPAVPECQFNHIMWYTTKNRMKVSGSWAEDGSQFSPQSSAVLQWYPFLR